VSYKNISNLSSTETRPKRKFRPYSKLSCHEAGREEVIYTLDGLEEKIFIARYNIKLPSETKIKNAQF